MKKAVILLYCYIAVAMAIGEANAAPTIDPTGDESVLVGNDLNFYFTSDFGFGMPNWSLDGASISLGMTIDFEIGEFNWTPTVADLGTHPVTVTATDESGSDSVTIQITATDVMLDFSDPFPFADEGSLLIFTATATLSGNGAVPIFSLEDGEFGAVPSGASIDPNTGVFQWVPAEIDGPNGYFFDVVATRSDNANTAKEQIFVEVYEVNTVHLIDPINDPIVVPNVQIAFAATVDDPDIPENFVFWSLDSASGTKGMSINAETGEFDWIPTSAQVGVHSVTITAADDAEPSLSDSLTFNILVTNIILDAIDDQTIIENNPLTFTANATLFGGEAVPVYSLVDGPGLVPSAASIDPDTGDFEWLTTEIDGPGTYVFDVVATRSDDPFAEVGETILIEVFESNTPPTIDFISDASIEAGSELTFIATGSDADLPPNLISWTLDSESLAKGMSINSTTGEFSWTPSFAQGGYHFATVIATDDADPALDASFTFNIEVLLAINLDFIGDFIINENDLLTFTANATMPDTGAVPVYSIEPSEFGAFPLGATIDPNTGVFSWQTGETDGPNIYSLDVVATRSDALVTTFDFTGDLDVANWSTAEQSAASTFNHTNTVLSIATGTGGGGTTRAITIVEDGFISFDWDFQFTGSGDFAFRYEVNNIPGEITRNSGSGSILDIPVTAGDVFEIYSWGVTSTSTYTASISNFAHISGVPSFPAVETITIDVLEVNTPPVIDPINNITVNADAPIAFTATAVDADLPANVLSWSIDSVSQATGMAINGTTGAFTWTPTTADAGIHSVTVSATDNGVPPLDHSVTFTIEVTHSIELAVIGDHFIDEGGLVSFTANATIPGGGATPIYSLEVFEFGFIPSGAAIEPNTGVFTWQTNEIDGPNVYVFDVVATRSDDSLVSIGETISIEVFEVNSPPAIDPISNLSVGPGSPLSFSATAVDTDLPANVVSWTLDPASEGKGMSINPATGAFTWTPISGDAGIHSVTVTATDDSSGPDFVIGVSSVVSNTLSSHNTTSFDLLRGLDQSGLTPTYVSGVTTTPEYLALNPGNLASTNSFAGDWLANGASSLPAEIILDLGADFQMDSFLFANTGTFGGARGINAGTMDVSGDPSFTTFTRVFDGPFPIGGNGLQPFQEILFTTPALGRYVRLNIASNHGDASFPGGMGELAFTTGNGPGIQSDTFTFTIDVALSIDLASIGNQSVGETDLLTFAANATVPDGGAVPIYTLEGSVPPGATIDSNTGIFSWQPIENDGPGFFTFDVVATRSDNATVTDRESITVDVIESNLPPTIDPVSDQTVEADSVLAFNITATDPDVPVNTISWALDTTSTGKGMTINAATGNFIWTPSSAQFGTHSVTVTATDDGLPNLNDTFTFNIAVTLLTINLATVGDQSIGENGLLSFTATATVPGGLGVPVYSLEGSVPAGASIDPNSGNFSWQTNESDGPGSYVFDVVATRSDNATVTDRETITVGVFEGNTPPTIDPISNQTVEAGNVLAFTAAASDPDIPPNGISWSLDTASAGKGMAINAATGAFTWTSTSAQFGSHSVTVTATDDGTPNLNHTFTFNIEVTLSITLATAGDQSIGETSLLTFTATATVPGGLGVPVYSLEGSVPAGASIDPNSGNFSWQTNESDGPGSYVFDVVATRSDNATVTDRETITVGVFEGNTPPTIDPISNQTVEAGNVLAFTAAASDPDIPPNGISWSLDTASAGKGMAINAATGAFTWTSTSAQFGSHSVTVTATDDGTPNLNHTFTFSIEVTLSITLATIGNQSIGETSLLSFTANATVPAGIAVPAYSLEGSVPANASIDPNSGNFSWQTDESDGPGSYVFDVVATRSDNTTITDRETITVGVFEGNTPPTIDPISNQTVEAGNVLAFTAAASDPDIPPNGISWSLDTASASKSMAINATTGAFTWIPTAAQFGTHSVTATATDDGSPNLNHTFTFNIEVTLSITLATIGNQSIGETSLLSFTANATVPAGIAVPTYSLEGSVPAGASIDPNNGNFSWQTDESHGPGSFVFDVVATRSDNATITDRETITVGVFEGNTPPTIDPISNQTVEAGNVLAFTAVASDPDIPPNGISWSLDTASAGKSMAINATTGAFTWIPSAAQFGTHAVTATATDDGSPNLNHTFTFNIEVTLSITLATIGNQSIGETSLLSFTANATVPGGLGVPVYSLEGSVPAGASIDPNNGNFSWQTNESHGPGSFVFDVVATRSDNVTISDRETITVGVFEGNTPPTIDPINDQVVEAGTLLAFTAVASDPDVPPNGISWSLDTASAGKSMAINAANGAFTWIPNAAQFGTHAVTATATDDGSPNLNHTFTFNIEVTLSITLATIGNQSIGETSLLSFTANATVPAGIAVPVYSLEGSVPAGAAIDSSSGNFSWQTNESHGPGSFVFDVVATRSDNATITDRETITVGVFEGNTPPTIDPISDQVVEAGSALAFTATASDPDIPPNGISLSLDTASAGKGMTIDASTGAFTWSPSSAHAGTHAVTVTATDDGLPTLNHTFTFNIEVTLSITLANIGNQSIGETGLLTFTASATVPGGIAVPVYSLEGSVPTGAIIDSNSGNFSWQTDENDGPGTYVFDVVATRSDNATITAREIISVGVLEGNTAPIIDPISDKTVEAGNVLAFTAIGTDPDVPPNGISWSLDTASIGKGMAINASSGAFSWTPAAAQAGNHNVTVIATDDGTPSLNHTSTFDIAVTLSIVLDVIGDQSIAETNLLTFTANATIPSSIAVPVYSLEGSIPAGASIDPSTGLFTWQTVASDGPGTYVFDVVATRSDNATVSDRETISVGVFQGNTPPTIDPISNMTIDAGALLAFTAIASDPDTALNAISWALDSASAGKGMAINATTGAFSWTPVLAQAGNHSVTVTATDDGVPPLNHTFTFDIEVILSIILDAIGDQSIAETNLLTFTANAIVPGGLGVPVYSLEGSVPAGATIDPNSGNFSWQTDENDGPSTHTFDIVATRSDNASTKDRETITVGVFEGNTPPTIDPIDDKTVEAGSLLAFTAMASDPDVPPNGISWTLDSASAGKGMTISATAGAFSWTPTSAQVGNHSVTVTATDDGVPSLTHTFTFDVDVTLTITLDAIGDQAIAETNLLAFTANAIVPNGIAVPVYSLEGSVPAGATIDPNSGNFSWQTDENDGPGTYVFDVVAARSDNATITGRETISVGVFEGNSPPIIDPISDQIVDAGTPLALTATATDPDVPPNEVSWTLDSASTGKGMAINATTGAFSWAPTSAHAGNHAVTVTATDDGNPALNHAFTFNIAVTLSIILDVIGDQSASETSLLTFTATAIVPGGIATPVYSLEGSIPSGATIDPSSGVFSWQTDEDDGPGTFILDVVATRSDNATITDRETISVGVFEGNTPPTIAPISDKSVDAGTALAFTATASDPDLPPNGISWTLDSTSTAKGMAINATNGAFSWTPTSAHAGNHAVTVTAADDGVPSLNHSVTFTIGVTLTITLDAIADQTVSENSLLSFTASATTPGGSATPVFSLAGSVPGGAAIDPSNGIFRWVPSESDGPGTFVFDVVATRSDNTTVSASETISVAVSEINANPIIAAISDLTIDAGSLLTFNATATDPDLPQNGISWSIDTQSAGKGMAINATTGAYNWTPLSAHAGNHAVTVIATDNGVPSLNHSVAFNIEVTLSIVLDLIGDQSVNENTSLAFTATATVPGGNAIPVYSLAGSVPTGASINPSSGVFQWVPAESNGPGIFSFDVVATRSDDATVSDRETIAVQVAEINSRPSIDPVNDTSVQAGSLLSFTATATDPDLPPNIISWTLDNASVAKGVSINAASGLFNWTPTAAQVGNHAITVTAQDNGIPTLDDSLTFSVDVIRATIELAPIADQAIDEKSPLSFTAVATVADGNATPIYSLEDGAVGSVPVGASIEPNTGVFQWVPDESNGPGTFRFNVVATRSDDPVAADRETVTIQVAEVNEAPSIDPINDATVQAFTLLALTATATDADLPENSITWTIDTVSAAKGMLIGADTGNFNWTPDGTQVGSHTVTVSTQDNGVAPSGDSLTFNVEVTAGVPPVVSLGTTEPDTLHEPNSFSLGQNDLKEGLFHFTVTRSTTSGDLPVILRLEDASQAEFAVDFSASVVNSSLESTPLNFTGNPPTASLTIPNGVAIVNIRIDVINDVAAEAAENITLAIVPSEKLDVGTGTATQIIPQNDFLVTNLGDFDPIASPNGGEGTLRHAINNAKAGLTRPNTPEAPVEITFDASISGEIVLTAGPLLLDTADLSITGPGSDLLAISGNGASRVIISEDTTGDRAYAISGLTLTNGSSTGNGGAIFNSESLTLTDCVVSNSSADHGGGITNEGALRLNSCAISTNTAAVYGGGIDNFSGTAFVTGCTINGNQADFGGGIENSTNGEIFIEGCSIFGNNALSGGGVDAFSSTTDIVNSTISGNSAGFGAGVFNEMSVVSIVSSTVVSNTAITSVGGILTSSNAPTGITEIYNTIVAGNVEGADIPSDIATNNPSFTDLDNRSTGNLIGDADSSGGLIDGTNLNLIGIEGLGVRPLDSVLAPLADNGGLTATHALIPGSPAIDAGDDQFASSLTFDQRGTGLEFDNPRFQRTFNVTDIGAFELQPDTAPVLEPEPRLEVISCKFNGSEATIKWRSIPGDRYEVISSPDLQDWIIIATDILAIGESSSYTETNPIDGQAFFIVRKIGNH